MSRVKEDGEVWLLSTVRGKYIRKKSVQVLKGSKETESDRELMESSPSLIGFEARVYPPL